MALTLGDSFKVDKVIECLHCNHKLDYSAQVDPDGSRPGPQTETHASIIICFNCGYVMLLDKDGDPRAPTRREVREIQEDGKVLLSLMALCGYMRHELDELKKERDAYAERAATVPGGCPPRD